MTSLPLDPARSAVVLVDYQQRLMPAIHDGAQVLAQALRLAAIARELGIPCVGTEQNPSGLGPNEPAIRAACGATIAKMHFDACADGLLQALRGCGPSAVETVVVAGCEAHVCLMQTALGLRRAGFDVRVVAEACGARRARDHALAMQRLHSAGAVVASLEMMSFEWLRSCEHPRFRAVLQLLKDAPL